MQRPKVATMSAADLITEHELAARELEIPRRRDVRTRADELTQAAGGRSKRRTSALSSILLSALPSRV